MQHAQWHKCLRGLTAAAACICGLSIHAHAQSVHPAIDAFTRYCFKAGQTADTARANMERVAGKPLPFTLTFWDKSLEAAPGTPAYSERRCEVVMDGDRTDSAVHAVQAKMATPPVFGTPLPLPDPFTAATGTAYIEARELLRRRVAVVHIGVNGAGAETFIRVDRLPPGKGFGS